jgi:hypothetical protein
LPRRISALLGAADSFNDFAGSAAIWASLLPELAGTFAGRASVFAGSRRSRRRVVAFVHLCFAGLFVAIRLSHDAPAS